MKASSTCGCAGILAVTLALLLIVSPVQAQINTSVSSVIGSPRFPWRAGSLAVASFDGVTMDAALPGVYICGIAFLLPSGQQWVSTGAGPVALVAADLDSDGDVDVAVAEQDGGSVSILTNDGLAGFTRTDSYATGDPSGPLYPTAIVAADIGHDGRLDLIVANRGGENVVVFRNTGGSFMLAQTVPVNNEPNSLAVADVDNDGWTDIAVACAADDTVKILRNEGGVLSLGSSCPAGAYPVAVAAADLDNDGDTDLAAADREAPQVTVLINDGTGQFSSAAVALSEPNARFEKPIDLQLVDIDSDGMVDIRCAGMTALNKGTGSFEVTDAYTLSGAAYGRGSLPGDLATYLGIAYAPSTSSNTVSVGPLSFQTGWIYVTTSGDDGNDGLSWSTAKRTVQAGMNAAQAGQQVWVAAGTYVERIGLKPGVALYGGFAGHETKLYQRDWITNETILDGNLTGTVVSISSGETPGTRIDGFTIRNGSGTYGGGVYCLGYSAKTIANNRISNNTGIGVYCREASSSVITGNTITGNSDDGVHCYAGTVITNNVITGNGGAGVACTSATIMNNTIVGNARNGIRCVPASDAVESPQIIGNTIATNRDCGIYCYQPTSSYSPLISGNTITDNSTSYPGGGGIYYCGSSSTTTTGMIAVNAIATNKSIGHNGGGIYCRDASPTIVGNTITGNSASKGGGIYYFSSSLTITNNVIAGNSASSTGGGIYCGSGSATIANNTIVGNTATNGGGIDRSYGSVTVANTIIAFNSSGIYGSTGGMRFNCVYANATYNYSATTDPTGTNGNISVDPKLAQRPYVNVHVQPDSPCVDAGDDSIASSSWGDIDGQARVQGVSVDIGADESDGTVWLPVPRVIVRVGPDGDNTSDGSSWLSAKRTVQAGIAAAAPSAGQVWVAAGTYMENISLPPGVAIYGGFAGSESSLSQRNWTANQTILNGNQAGSVIVAWSGADPATRIDGFTIRNGSGTMLELDSNYYGGGIYCYNHASPTIANNLITDNSAHGGAGICCYSYSSPAIVNNTITRNAAASYGGGIYCRDYSSPTIAGNAISGNSTNTMGGGICCWFYSSPTITNNTIVSNAREGIRCQGSSAPTIANTIVTFNYAGISGSGATCLHNCVYGNVAYDYPPTFDRTGTNGNISADPLFALASAGADEVWGTADDVLEDLRLLPFSPCIDAGGNADVPADAADLDGDGDVAELLPIDLAGRARFLDDPQVADTGTGTAPIVDIGTYERCRPVGDVDGDWLTDVVDLLYMVAAFGSASGDPNYNPACDFNSDGSVDVADLLTLVESFGR